MSDHSRVGDEEARELWRRATELQRVAERRELAAEPDAADEGALVAPDAGGLPVEQVVAAATEAGISPDHVLFAVAERNLPDRDAIRPDRWTARWLRRLVGGADAVETSRFVPAPAAHVLETVQAVASGEPFHLTLEDGVGRDVVEGVVLVFRSPGTFSSGVSSFHQALDIADGRVVLVTVREEDDGTRVRFRAPLYRRGLNLALSGGATGVAGGGGAAGGVAVGGALAGLIGGGAVVAAAGVGAVGAVAGGGLGLWAYRRMYRWAWRQGDAAVRRLAGAVVAAAEQGEGREGPAARLLVEETSS